MLQITHTLEDLRAELRNTGKKHETALKRASIDGGKRAKTAATRSIIKRGAFHKAPGEPEAIRKGTTFRPDLEDFGGTLVSRRKARGLHYWVHNPDPKRQYRSGALVRQGELMNQRIASKSKAFVRNLSGNKQLAARDPGSDRAISKVYKSTAASRLLVDESTSPVVIDRYFNAFQKTYQRNYYGK